MFREIFVFSTKYNTIHYSCRVSSKWQFVKICIGWM